MIRNMLATWVVLTVTACASLLPTEDQAILDFSPPPSSLQPARLLRLNGVNIGMFDSRSSFWVDAGVHKIKVSCLACGPFYSGRNVQSTARTDPGIVTIEVEPGKRYRIATMVTDKNRSWEPVIWRVEGI